MKRMDLLVKTIGLLLVIICIGCFCMSCTEGEVQEPTESSTDGQSEAVTTEDTETSIIADTEARDPAESVDTEDTETSIIADTEAQDPVESVDTEDTTEASCPADTVPTEDPALNVFPEDGKNIEIGIFWEPPAEYTTPEQYDWIRDANITFIEITNHKGGNSKENVAKQLQLAAERNLHISYNVTYDDMNVMNAPLSYYQTLAENPVITGIHVVDEPVNPWAYAEACATITRSGLTPRLNFLPYWATWVFENYTGHIEDTVVATGKENYGYLSYDHYPFPYNGGDPDMFYNLDLFRQIGLKYDVPTAFYIQSIGEAGNFRRTNGNEIRYHTSAGLAYGLKSMTYFTWWTTGECDPKDYAIISPYGEKTDIYDDVAAVNAQILKVGPVLSNLDALEIYHTSGRETGITDCASTDVPVYAKGGLKYGYIISLMEDKTTGRDYIMIVNKDYTKAVTDSFTVADSITHLYNLNNGTYEEMDISAGSVEITLQPGGFILMAVGQHDNVVDRVAFATDNKAAGKAPNVDTINPGNGHYVYCVTDGIRDNSNPVAKGYRSPRSTGWVEVDLGCVTPVNRVDIYPTGTKFAHGDYFPQDFTLEVSSDGETWVKVAEETNYTKVKTEVPVFTFDTVECRYVRLCVTKCAGNYFEIAEIEVYHDDGTVAMPDNDSFYAEVGDVAPGTNIAREKSIQTSSAVAGWESYKMNDGDPTTGWTSGLNRHDTENGEEWLTVDLVKLYTLDKVVLQPRANDEYFPKAYVIEVSDDGENFRVVYNGTHEVERSGMQPIEIVFNEEVTAKYVRVRGTVLRETIGFNDGFLFSLMEIEIYNK